MRVSAEAHGILARKYAGREFVVFDLKTKQELGPWSAAVGAVYSARDEATRLTGEQNRFMVRHREAINVPA